MPPTEGLSSPFTCPVVVKLEALGQHLALGRHPIRGPLFLLLEHAHLPSHSVQSVAAVEIEGALTLPLIISDDAPELSACQILKTFAKAGGISCRPTLLTHPPWRERSNTDMVFSYQRSSNMHTLVIAIVA